MKFMPNNKSKEINGTAAINDALILAGKKNKNVIKKPVLIRLF